MTDEEDPTEMRVDGPTPAGGAWSTATFTDASGNPVPKSQATNMVIREYAPDGSVIATTMGTVGR